MQSPLLFLLLFWTVTLYGLPQFNNSTSTISDLTYNGSVSFDQDDKTPSTSLGQLEYFENKVRVGIRYLRSHGVGSQYRLHGILARPSDTHQTGKRAEDFTKLTILFADTALTTIKFIETTERGWSGPHERPFSEMEAGSALWDINSLVYKLSEAFTLLNHFDYYGPWSMIMAGWPDTDPVTNRAGREPWFYFFDAVQEGRIVSVGGASYRLVTRGPRQLEGVSMLQYPNAIEEITR